MDETLQYYTNSWRSVLQDGFKLKDTTVSELIQQKIAQFDWNPELLFHDPPMSFVADVVLRYISKQTILGPNSIIFSKRIQALLEDGKPCRDYSDTGKCEDVARSVWAYMNDVGLCGN
jgi:hypothetical protein